MWKQRGTSRNEQEKSDRSYENWLRCMSRPVRTEEKKKKSKHPPKPAMQSPPNNFEAAKSCFL